MAVDPTSPLGHMTPEASSWAVGIDSGGTFTDLFALDENAGAIRTLKVASTPSAPVKAVVEALDQSATNSSIGRLVHGTTVATNALLERRGANVCLLTTAGFEDVAAIQRLNRRYAYRLDWEKPVPLVRRRHIIGVEERIGADSAVVQPLGREHLNRVADRVADLLEMREIDSVAIALLFAYLNDTHECALEQAIRARCGDIPISLSSRSSPLWREYERVSTTVADAYVRLLMTRYLDDLAAAMSSRANGTPLLILKSSGGTGSVASIRPAPVTTLLSGLAGGAVGGAYFASAVGERRCITFDMGGTSTDIGLVEEGVVRQVSEYELEWGIPVVTPVVDVHTIGAGGGSIAQVDGGGLIRVGPESAGAVPGPACYGKGGREPTVTDADVTLGRLNPEYFLGGRMKLDRSLAETALTELGKPLGMTSESAALSVVAIANENMANAIRLVTVERGIDPRDYALVAFGGAGPVHACEVAEAVGINRVVIPPNPGLCSAFGAAIAQLRVDRFWSLGRRSDDVDERALRERMQAAEADAVAELRADGLQGDAHLERTIACRYYQQNYEQEVSVPDTEPGFVVRAADRFHKLHQAFYGYAFADEPVELVHCKVAARGSDAPLVDPRVWQPEPAVDRGTRLIAQTESAAEEVPVIGRGSLGDVRSGPLILEEEDSTVFVPAGWTVRDGTAACLLLEHSNGNESS